MTIYFIAYGILIFMYCAEKIQHHSDAKKKIDNKLLYHIYDNAGL